MTEKKICGVPTCSGEAAVRGLCKSCYQSAAGAVRGGVVTWDQLEEQGIAEPSKRGGSLFTDWLEDNLQNLEEEGNGGTPVGPGGVNPQVGPLGDTPVTSGIIGPSS